MNVESYLMQSAGSVKKRGTVGWRAQLLILLFVLVDTSLFFFSLLLYPLDNHRHAVDSPRPPLSSCFLSSLQLTSSLPALFLHSVKALSVNFPRFKGNSMARDKFSLPSHLTFPSLLPKQIFLLPFDYYPLEPASPLDL